MRHDRFDVRVVVLHEGDDLKPDRVLAAMNDPGARRLLESADLRLAYIALDGIPRVVPVGFHRNGVTLVIGTVPGSAKVAALQSKPDSR